MELFGFPVKFVDKLKPDLSDLSFGLRYGFPRPGGTHQLYKPGCDLAPFTDGELMELNHRMARGDIPVTPEEQARVLQAFRDRRKKARIGHDKYGAEQLDEDDEDFEA